MGKRSSGFERRERDLYPTPFKAVPPLIPWLRGVRTFAEPCAGDGDLVRHLESFGLRCVYQGDISTGQDALDLTPADINGALIITNPPFSRISQPLLRRLIAHFLRIASTVWLLLPADFASNRWFAPFLSACTDIVPIGRVKWIAGSKYDGGFENSSWYRLNAHHTAGPIHHPRGAVPMESRASLCAQCSKPYLPLRSDSRFCSDACRQASYRRRSKRNASVTREAAE